ncbi:MAG TPA: hypothetical protein VFG10_12625 [Saprospiraceae bacterium]|nr:hypothetical protein [Saprospiraceae bacterium]
MPRLVHVSSDDKGYHRKGRGKGFEYIAEDGKRVTDKNEHARIKALRIPPAWKNVWICENPDGHLQATGIDARGRKQYLYHEEWNRRSQINKFDRMAAFGKALADIRKRTRLDLNKEGWPREKVISLVISLLDQSALRIGNKAYEQENGTFGLTTLRRKHLKIEKGNIAFEFKAKGGLYRKTQIRGKKLTRLIIECSELPGQEVFRYMDDEGNTHPVFSHDVNGYLQEITGGEFTAKDFRTWGGTVGALELLPEALAEMESTSMKSLTKCILKKVSEKLGNTVAVCRTYYIHPVILASAEEKHGDLDKLTEKAVSKYDDLKNQLSEHELTALFLIESKAS